MDSAAGLRKGGVRFAPCDKKYSMPCREIVYIDYKTGAQDSTTKGAIIIFSLPLPPSRFGLCAVILTWVHVILQQAAARRPPSLGDPVRFPFTVGADMDILPADGESGCVSRQNGIIIACVPYCHHTYYHYYYRVSFGLPARLY